VVRVTVSRARTFLVALLLLTAFARGATADQQAPLPHDAPVLAPPPSPVIPLAEVAWRATEVEALLRAYRALQASSPATAKIEKQLPEASALIGLELERTVRLLREQPTLETLEVQQELWTRRQLLTTTWLEALTRRITHLQEALTRLADQHQTWSQAQDAARAAQAPEPILEQIAGVLAAIEAARTPLQAQRAIALELQSRVAREVGRCQTALAQVAEAQRQAVGGLLEPERPPIWNPQWWVGARTVDAQSLRDAAFTWWREIVKDLRDPASGLRSHGALFVVLAALLWAARRWTHRAGAAVEGASFATAVFDHPFSAALLIGLISHPLVYGVAPPEVRHLFQVLLLVPVIQLTRPVVDPRLFPGLLLLAAVFILDSVRRVVGTLAIEPAILSVEMLAGLLGLGYVLTVGPLRRPLVRDAESDRLHATRVIGALILVLFTAALVCAVLGYIRLGRVLASGVLGSTFLALVLWPVVRVSTGLVALAFRMWPIRLLRMIQHHRDLLERRTHRVLVWLAFGVWLTRSLDYVGVLGPARALGQSVLNAKLQRGALSISVEDVLAFALTLWVAYLLSAFVRFALEEDVYPRAGLARGLSYALSSLLNYVLLTLGFLAGLAILGLDLTKVTIVAGAFGVGIGFGLQSVVNNFVSGLILLFERPIHVGDTIEAGGITGSVRRIGIRSSVVRTGQGAEVIVPNAQLVTERVTNWTLSDRQRLIELPVGVSYSAHPKRVIEMLEAVAHAHAHVLRQPPPRAFLTGFGDSSINFELRAWTDQFDQWFQIRSELAAAVYDAGQAAGISFPFPQREVRLLQDPSDRPDRRPGPQR
jgi:small-conductance mechanosensitive channel